MTGSTRSILIIDDDAGIRRALGSTLTALGYRTDEASSGAWARSGRQAPVRRHFADINMPGQNGIEACRDLRRESPVPGNSRRRSRHASIPFCPGMLISSAMASYWCLAARSSPCSPLELHPSGNRGRSKSIPAPSGFRTDEASSGEHGLDLAARHQYDAILLDINMPGQNGIEACRDLRRELPGAGILMITVRDSEDDKVEALDAGADDFITKPFVIPQPGSQLRDDERLGNEVIGPGIERLHFVVLAVAHCNHQDARAGQFAPQIAARLNTVLSRHVDIQQNGVEPVPGGQIEPMLAAGSFIRPESGGRWDRL